MFNSSLVPFTSCYINSNKPNRKAPPAPICCTLDPRILPTALSGIAIRRDEIDFSCTMTQWCTTRKQRPVHLSNQQQVPYPQDFNHHGFYRLNSEQLLFYTILHSKTRSTCFLMLKRKARPSREYLLGKPIRFTAVEFGHSTGRSGRLFAALQRSAPALEERFGGGRWSTPRVSCEGRLGRTVK